MNSRLTIFLSWLVSLSTPIVLLGIALRVLLTPVFYKVEYNMLYFPPDEFGLTKADRLRWTPYAVNYLINSADISYLGDLKFDDGTPLFNERELRHMHDVKVVTQGALKVWYVSLASLIILALWAWRGDWKFDFIQGLRRGGWLTIGLVIVLGLFGSTAFDQFFIYFHKLFFTGDSWRFLFSDTLIRLFPERFWEDAFLWAAIIVLGGSLALIFGLKPK